MNKRHVGKNILLRIAFIAAGTYISEIIKCEDLSKQHFKHPITHFILTLHQLLIIVVSEMFTDTPKCIGNQQFSAAQETVSFIANVCLLPIIEQATAPKVTLTFNISAV